MKIYVASSWRNEYQPLVVSELCEDGHDVYDFRHPEPGNNGFSWRSIGDGWQSWTVKEYLAALQHPISEHGFALDMNALRACDVCVYLMPCGVSASLEAGWAKGAGKPTALYVPALREPDLMVKMFDFVTDDLVALCQWVNKQKSASGSPQPEEQEFDQRRPIFEQVSWQPMAPKDIAARIRQVAANGCDKVGTEHHCEQFGCHTLIHLAEWLERMAAGEPGGTPTE
jgi:hypothetical protein